MGRMPTPPTKGTKNEKVVYFTPLCAHARMHCTHGVSLLPLLQCRDHPVEAFVQAVARRCRARLNIPLPRPQIVEAHFFSHLGDGHRPREVLFIRETEQDSVRELRLRQHPFELCARIGDALAVVRVDDENDPLSILIIVSPQWSNLKQRAEEGEGGEGRGE